MIMLLLQANNSSAVIQPDAAHALVRSSGAVVTGLTARLPICVAVDHKQDFPSLRLYKLAGYFI